MQSSPEAADRLARRAAALAFATQGMVFISLTTRLPRFSDRWDLSEVQLSLVLLMIVLLAGAGSVVAELVAHRSSSAGTLRAGLLTVGVAVPVVAAAPTGLVFVLALAAYGVGLGIVDASSTCIGRGRAPLRPHDPAVVPRRLNLRRHRRRLLRAGRGARAALDGLPARCGAALALAAPYLRRERGEAARRGRADRRPLAPDPARRVRDGALLHGRHRLADLGPDLPRRRGRRPAARWWRSRRCPTSSPAWSSAWPATRSWRGTAPRWSCAPARSWPRWRYWWSSPRRAGRSPSSASPCSALASR